MIAVSFALGVVEPEASGIGGDGAAVLYPEGHEEADGHRLQGHDADSRRRPTTRRSWQDGRIVADGPAAANIPGVVAGLDYLYRNYGSGKVKWEELVAPAITLADEGFILDEALPTSIAEGRRFLEKWPEAAKIYLPGRQGAAARRSLLQQGLREHAARDCQKGGADAFYRGEIAQKIAADMEENGGIITLRRSRAVSRDRARAGRRALSRPHALCRRPAGVDRHPAVRVAADARELPAEAGRARDDRSPTTSTT